MADITAVSSCKRRKEPAAVSTQWARYTERGGLLIKLSKPLLAPIFSIVPKYVKMCGCFGPFLRGPTVPRRQCFQFVLQWTLHSHNVGTLNYEVKTHIGPQLLVKHLKYHKVWSSVVTEIKLC